MNNVLENQLIKILGEGYQLDDTQKKVLEEVSKSYDAYEEQMDALRTAAPDTMEINSLNQELRQSVEEQTLVISNLKKAIASLEPNAQVLQTAGAESLDETSYLTESLIKVIEAHKEATDNLKHRKVELEQLNTLLGNEKRLLAEEKAKDRAVLFAIGDGLIVTDEVGNIVMVNNSFENLLGWNKDEAIGQDMGTLIQNQDKIGQITPAEARLHKKAVKDGRSYSTPAESTFFYVRKDKSIFPVMITVAPIIKDNKIIGAVEVFRDITKEKEIDEAKSEFVSLASHQLRTPLSSINWYTEMLLDDNLEGTVEEYKSYLGEIETAANRMSDMINSLLNVSRLELGTFAIEPEVVNILEIAGNVINELKPKIIEKGHKIEGKHNDQLPPIKTDPKLVSMVFQNLISNAVKYTPNNGTIVITMTMSEDGKSVISSVSDNGYGIPEEESKKIFTKMFRASNIMKHDTDGNGLGLYIIRLILNSLGGEIWFETEEEKGSTFFFSLPLETAYAEKEGKALD